MEKHNKKQQNKILELGWNDENSINYSKEFIVDNILLFKIGIRNRTYRSLVAEKTFYIEHLESQLEERELSLLSKSK